ncbi:hypothetical protein HPB51_007581 [Rhipicephalus microplus]|uniref:THAP-type domain-containing protein n=1 Tax=Rhipicephalus microplus TaxID=6941 RepID=A0A9J6EFN7_RHIMP|nr:hypothetical protein HPB51_007581 [Rhipicephalus microplus]
MVYCAIVGCSSRTQSKQMKIESSSRDPGFFKVPKVRTRECEMTRFLSEKRRHEWIARINWLVTTDPDKYRVCSVSRTCGGIQLLATTVHESPSRARTPYSK